MTKYLSMKILLMLNILFLLNGNVRADLCDKVKDLEISQDTKKDVNYFEKIFPDKSFWGTRTWNEVIVECNRKRDTNGNQLTKILSGNDFQDLKDMLKKNDLDEVIVRGMYNFFGNIVTQQKYRYTLKKDSGVWKMTIPYEAEINDVAKGRIDFYMGALNSSSSGHSKTYHAWQFYETNQVTIADGRATLKSDALSIAETLCSDFTYVEGKKGQYKDMKDENSYKRDRENKHIDLGKIQFSYDKVAWKEGCRVKRNQELYWENPETSELTKITPDKWILDNFIRTAQSYWSIPDVFQLVLWLKGHNDQDVASSTRNKFKEGDFLKIRFATKFMPYGGNQVYKTSLIQFNNFSTMTTDDTYWHEVGHAFGLDDEYGKDDKKNDCEASRYNDFKASEYQMCNCGVDEKRSIYHYVATSRYTVTSICVDDNDCQAGEFCNKRLGINRCLPDGSSMLAEDCIKDKECKTNKCQGSGSDKKCVCGKDDDCGNNKYCNERIGQPNRCLADGTKALNDKCDKDKQCKSGKCDGTSNDKQCVCAQDSDCGNDKYCNERIGEPNRCLADGTKALNDKCDKDKQCKSGKCEQSGDAKKCVCAKDEDCSGNKKCKTPVFEANYCE
jgi:hypothetical protein